MQHKATKSFEELSAKLVTLAVELSTTKDKDEGDVQNAIKPLRHDLIVMLAGITKSLSRIFKL